MDPVPVPAIVIAAMAILPQTTKRQLVPQIPEQKEVAAAVIVVAWRFGAHLFAFDTTMSN
jgi:hypothetical protein